MSNSIEATAKKLKAQFDMGVTDRAYKRTIITKERFFSNHSGYETAAMLEDMYRAYHTGYHARVPASVGTNQGGSNG